MSYLFPALAPAPPRDQMFERKRPERVVDMDSERQQKVPRFLTSGPSAVVLDQHSENLTHCRSLHQKFHSDTSQQDKYPWSVLILHSNLLDKLDGVHLCYNLRKLDLSGNRIRELPNRKFWRHLPQLEILHLHNNRIESVHNLLALRVLSSLRILTCYGNPVQHHPAYRHVLVNSVPRLALLDFFLVSDQELIEGAHFGPPYGAFSPALRLQLQNPDGLRPHEQMELIHHQLLLVRMKRDRYSPVSRIQRWWRGCVVRRNMRVYRAAATCIQRAFRAYRSGKFFLRQRARDSPNTLYLVQVNKLSLNLLMQLIHRVELVEECESPVLLDANMSLLSVPSLVDARPLVRKMTDRRHLLRNRVPNRIHLGKHCSERDARALRVVKQRGCSVVLDWKRKEQLAEECTLSSVARRYPLLKVISPSQRFHKSLLRHVQKFNVENEHYHRQEGKGEREEEEKKAVELAADQKRVKRTTGVDLDNIDDRRIIVYPASAVTLVAAALCIQSVFRSFRVRKHLQPNLGRRLLRRRAHVCLVRWWRNRLLKARLFMLAGASRYVNSINSRTLFLRADAFRIAERAPNAFVARGLWFEHRAVFDVAKTRKTDDELRALLLEEKQEREYKAQQERRGKEKKEEDEWSRKQAIAERREMRAARALRRQAGEEVSSDDEGEDAKTEAGLGDRDTGVGAIAGSAGGGGGRGTPFSPSRAGSRLGSRPVSRASSRAMSRAGARRIENAVAGDRKANYHCCVYYDTELPEPADSSHVRQRLFPYPMWLARQTLPNGQSADCEMRLLPDRLDAASDVASGAEGEGGAGELPLMGLQAAAGGGLGSRPGSRAAVGSRSSSPIRSAAMMMTHKSLLLSQRLSNILRLGVQAVVIKDLTKGLTHMDSDIDLSDCLLSGSDDSDADGIDSGDDDVDHDLSAVSAALRSGTGLTDRELAVLSEKRRAARRDRRRRKRLHMRSTRARLAARKQRHGAVADLVKLTFADVAEARRRALCLLISTWDIFPVQHAAKWRAPPVVAAASSRAGGAAADDVPSLHAFSGISDDDDDKEAASEQLAAQPAAKRGFGLAMIAAGALGPQLTFVPLMTAEHVELCIEWGHDTPTSERAVMYRLFWKQEPQLQEEVKDGAMFQLPTGAELEDALPSVSSSAAAAAAGAAAAAVGSADDGGVMADQDRIYNSLNSLSSRPFQSRPGTAAVAEQSETTTAEGEEQLLLTGVPTLRSTLKSDTLGEQIRRNVEQQRLDSRRAKATLEVIHHQRLLSQKTTNRMNLEMHRIKMAHVAEREAQMKAVLKKEREAFNAASRVRDFRQRMRDENRELVARRKMISMQNVDARESKRRMEAEDFSYVKSATALASESAMSARTRLDEHKMKVRCQLRAEEKKRHKELISRREAALSFVSQQNMLSKQMQRGLMTRHRRKRDTEFKNRVAVKREQDIARRMRIRQILYRNYNSKRTAALAALNADRLKQTRRAMQERNEQEVRRAHRAHVQTVRAVASAHAYYVDSRPGTAFSQSASRPGTGGEKKQQTSAPVGKGQQLGAVPRSFLAPAGAPANPLLQDGLGSASRGGKRLRAQHPLSDAHLTLQFQALDMLATQLTRKHGQVARLLQRDMPGLVATAGATERAGGRRRRQSGGAGAGESARMTRLNARLDKIAATRGWSARSERGKDREAAVGLSPPAVVGGGGGSISSAVSLLDRTAGSSGVGGLEEKRVRKQTKTPAQASDSSPFFPAPKPSLPKEARKARSRKKTKSKKKKKKQEQASSSASLAATLVKPQGQESSTAAHSLPRLGPHRRPVNPAVVPQSLRESELALERETERERELLRQANREEMSGSRLADRLLEGPQPEPQPQV